LPTIPRRVLLLEMTYQWFASSIAGVNRTYAYPTKKRKTRNFSAAPIFLLYDQISMMTRKFWAIIIKLSP